MLGPLEVRDGAGSPREVSGTRLRALLVLIVGHPGDGQPNARMSARYARIRPALFPSFSRLWVNRGE